MNLAPIRGNRDHTGTGIGTRRSLLVISLIGLFQGPALANPSGATVVRGDVTLSQTDAQTLNITNSPGAIINWQDFSNNLGEVTRFLQQNDASAVLNRVIGHDPSQILGSLLSNGKVFLINPNGIVFGAGARVDTAGLIASSLNLTDADFIANQYNFAGGANAGAVINRGFIKSSKGGEVLLIAPNVENSGIIQTEDGTILLAAGQKLTLTSLDVDHISFDIQAPDNKALNVGSLLANGGAAAMLAGSVLQRGHIQANRLSRDADGRIRLIAQDTLEVSGSVTATGANGVAGGDIQMTGNTVALNNAQIRASGESGGTVLVGGDFQGTGKLANAQDTTIDAQSSIHASATGTGDGGKIIVWSDNTTTVDGTLKAKGGPMGGDGGFIETSGKKTLEFSRPADVSAPRGKAGTWLLDPENIDIDGGKAASIETALNQGSNVSIKTSSTGDGEGNITVSAAIAKTEGADASLGLEAHGRIDVNAPISSTSGKLDVSLRAGTGIAINNSISTNGGSVSSKITGSPDPVADSVDNATGSDSETEPTPTDVASIEPDVETVTAPTESITEISTIPDSDISAATDSGMDIANTDTTVDTSLSNDVIADVEIIDTTTAADTGITTEVATVSSTLSEVDITNTETVTQTTDIADTGAIDVSDPLNSGTDLVTTDTTFTSDVVDVTDTAATSASPTDSTTPDTGTTDINSGTITDPVITADASKTDSYNTTIEISPEITVGGDIITNGGNIIIEGGETGTVIVTGTVDASNNNEGETGGTIHLLGDRVGLFDEAVVDASGDAGGGEILIGGDQQGLGEVQNASATYIGENVTVKSDALTNGNGGKVIVFAVDSAKIYGNLKARGGKEGGDGGFVETSGLFGLDVRGNPDTSAANGEGGTWLIDPYFNINITNTTTTFMDTGLDPWKTTATGANINVSDIYAGLSTGGKTVRISTEDKFGIGGESGDINLLTDLNYNGITGTGTLELISGQDINITTGRIYDSTAGGESLNVTFNAGRNINISKDIDGGSTGNLTFNATGNINQTAGTLSGNVLTTTSNDATTGTNLSGVSMVNKFNATETGGGDVLIRNFQDLDVTGINTTGDVSVKLLSSTPGNNDLTISGSVIAGGTMLLQAWDTSTNYGDITVTASGGATTVQSGGLLTVTGKKFTLQAGSTSGDHVDVRSNGGSTITLTDGLEVLGGTNSSDALLQNFSGNQTINALYVYAVATSGGEARINNSGGSQSITTTGANGSNAIKVWSDGQTAEIKNSGSGSQTITINGSGGDFVVLGTTNNGDALVTSSTSQTVTFGGTNSDLLIGAASATGTSLLQGNQTINMNGNDVLIYGGQGSGETVGINSFNTLALSGANNITLSGGSNTGTNTEARISASNGITLSTATLSVTGGSSGSSMKAGVATNSGTLSITASSGINVYGGIGGTSNDGFLYSGGSLAISTPTLNVGNASMAHSADIQAVGNTSINVGTLNILAGSSANANAHVGADGNLTALVGVNYTGGTATITGGSGLNAHAGLYAGNTLDVTATNLIQITGGDNTDTEATIDGAIVNVTAPDINVNGGGPGGTRNFGAIVAVNGDNSITATNVTLNPGSGTDSDAILAAINGNVILNVSGVCTNCTVFGSDPRGNGVTEAGIYETGPFPDPVVADPTADPIVEPVTDPEPTGDIATINDESTDSLVVLLNTASLEDPNLDSLLGTGDGPTDDGTTGDGTTGDGTSADGEEGTADTDETQDKTGGTTTGDSNTDSKPAPKKVLSCNVG